MFPNRDPMERDASSPEPMVYSFIYTCQSPQLRTSPKKWGKNIQSLSTDAHADRRPTYNEVWHGSPKGLFTTVLSLPQCHAAFSTLPSTLAWVDLSLISQRVTVTLNRVTPAHVTASHMTRGTNPRNPEVQTRV
jgi:hypothetical protein